MNSIFVMERALSREGHKIEILNTKAQRHKERPKAKQSTKDTKKNQRPYFLPQRVAEPGHRGHREKIEEDKRPETAKDKEKIRSHRWTQMDTD